MHRKRELRRLSQSDDVQHCEVHGEKRTAPCFNGSTCRTDDGSPARSSPCTCRDGTRGPSCEEICTLQCENGGQCLFENDNTTERGEESPWGPAKDGMFCRCRNDFVGLQCEQEAVSCGPDGRICLAGTTCVQNTATKAYRCAQPKVNRCNPSPLYPEFYEGMAVVAFCLNGGTCREHMIDNELYGEQYYA